MTGANNNNMKKRKLTRFETLLDPFIVASAAAGGGGRGGGAGTGGAGIGKSLEDRMAYEADMRMQRMLAKRLGIKKVRR